MPVVKTSKLVQPVILENASAITTLHHALKINAPRHRIYEAPDRSSSNSEWHLGGIEGSVETDGTLTLTPKPGVRFSWQTELLQEDVSITQRVANRVLDFIQAGNASGHSQSVCLPTWPPAIGRVRQPRSVHFCD
jgi:hypothetical protein